MTQRPLMSTLHPLFFFHLHLRAARTDSPRRYTSCERVAIACLVIVRECVSPRELERIKSVAAVCFAQTMIRG